MSKIFDFVKPGVITGDDVQKVFQVAKENNFALPVSKTASVLTPSTPYWKPQLKLKRRLSFSSPTVVLLLSLVKA